HQRPEHPPVAPPAQQQQAPDRAVPLNPWVAAAALALVVLGGGILLVSTLRRRRRRHAPRKKKTSPRRGEPEPSRARHVGVLVMLVGATATGIGNLAPVMINRAGLAGMFAAKWNLGPHEVAPVIRAPNAAFWGFALGTVAWIVMRRLKRTWIVGA